MRLRRRTPPTGSRCTTAALRVAVPDRTISLTDRLQGEYAQNLAKDCGDFILKRSDGVYAYQLAVVVDDALSGVTEVVRGRDLLSSAPRQIFLYRCLGYPPPSYLHTPLLLDESGERLSKRGGSSNLAELRRRFSSPEPILGALAHAAGLLPRPEPAALADLIAVYDEKKLVRDDIRLPAVFP